ncbi:MAG TPA: TatD family hydrolase, partial [Chitinophagales bacterium]|nr:TatD family hydrolase [Chitinophagales bacterium]
HVLSYKGFLMGIGGVVTFKNSGLDKVLETIPLSKLVLETDAPYLAPVPNRGKRNETAFITAVASRMSQIFDVSVAEIAEITSANAKELFRI